LQQTNHIRCVISYLLARSSERLINGCSVARDRQRLTVIEDRPTLSYVNEQQFDPEGNDTEISMKSIFSKLKFVKSLNTKSLEMATLKERDKKIVYEQNHCLENAETFTKYMQIQNGIISSCRGLVLTLICPDVAKKMFQCFKKASLLNYF
jgi:hypothetical protein